MQVLILILFPNISWLQPQLLFVLELFILASLPIFRLQLIRGDICTSLNIAALLTLKQNISQEYQQYDMLLNYLIKKIK